MSPDYLINAVVKPGGVMYLVVCYGHVSLRGGGKNETDGTLSMLPG